MSVHLHVEVLAVGSCVTAQNALTDEPALAKHCDRRDVPRHNECVDPMQRHDVVAEIYDGAYGFGREALMIPAFQN